MQLTIRILIFAVLISIIEFYFLYKLIKSLKVLFPKLISKRIRIVSKTLIVVLNIYPLFLILNWSIAEITSSQVLIPQNDFFDYLIIYPFWIFFFIAVQSILFFLLL